MTFTGQMLTSLGTRKVCTMRQTYVHTMYNIL